MIVKLKCVETCGYDRFIAVMVYDVIAHHVGNCYWVIDDDGEEALVSTDKPSGCGKGVCNNCNGKWKVVN